MKKTLLTLSFFLVNITTNAQYCPDNNHPHAIDLGLPSGTLWACCNVGASSPEDNGNYYAWGETETKYRYESDNCKTYHRQFNDIAGTQYDVAHVQWGDYWQMPTIEQINELRSKCVYTWMLNGALFRGPNGNKLYLPAAGRYYQTNIVSLNQYGYYWSSSPHNNDESYWMWLLPYDAASEKVFRFFGQPVRPINISTNNIYNKTYNNVSAQAVYNLYGIKVADSTTEINNQSPGIYIVNGKKIVIK